MAAADDDAVSVMPDETVVSIANGNTFEPDIVRVVRTDPASRTLLSISLAINDRFAVSRPTPDDRLPRAAALIYKKCACVNAFVQQESIARFGIRLCGLETCARVIRSSATAAVSGHNVIFRLPVVVDFRFGYGAGLQRLSG